MTRFPLTPKQIAIPAVLIICCILVGYGLLGFYKDHSASGAVNFEEYKPLVLPPDTSIQGSYIDVWKPWHYRFMPRYTKQLDLYLNSSGISAILEQRNTTFAYTCNSGGGTCVFAETPHHQKYLLTTYYEQAGSKTTSSRQEVEWLRGDTYIQIVLQGSPVRTYSQTTWSKVIDSFVPVHYSKLPIKRYYVEP